MKKNVLTKSILTLILGTIIITSAIIPVTRAGEPPEPEMAVIEYNINI
ncbi:hypothetical protein [Clostridium algidicarnis]|uniref:Uncharacterized protein n=1 Tax=Clostridium algidicarnis DSM 15099 TaxID=1121295 RepID=A0A2S6FW16_9CLOT|nr:hypothetical protein [Clostridium algidicarnis]PPK46983.1 hypothetical protein BD821_11423 [Clostridium algidicarnis DSM 15099]